MENKRRYRMNLRRMSLRLLVFLGLGVLCSGCVSQYKVVVEFSPALQGHFNEVPTLEVDIAAITDGEAGEVKQAGVEKYFAPDSGIRERLQSQTCFFSRESNGSFVLPSRAPVWQNWLLKDPANILVIASLPHDPSISPEADPRLLLIKMTRSYIFARTIYILVEPKKIIQISKSSSESKTDEPQVIEQWVEFR
jgi:hypothetical protein